MGRSPDRESGIGPGVVFHVEADEAIHAADRLDDPHHVGLAQVAVYAQTHLRQLHAHIRVQASFRQSGDRRQVSLDGGGGVLR